ncbi:MAG: hypothetical protein U0325_33340 [Polyangiales bacterium]
MSDPTLLLALQRVVYERPPAHTLQRGLLALPRAPVVVAVILAFAALAVSVVRRRRGAR